MADLSGTEADLYVELAPGSFAPLARVLDTFPLSLPTPEGRALAPVVLDGTAAPATCGGTCRPSP